MSEVRIVAPTRDRVGESPVWDARAQALYWVDIEGRHIRRWDRLRNETLSWDLPQRVGCIALAEDGGLVAAMESGIFAVTLGAPPQAEVRLLAELAHPAPGMRFNDGRCDARGRLWVGSMVMDMSLAVPLGGLYCLDARGLTGPHVEGLVTPNGLGFSPDGRTLYLSDSHPTVQKIWAFDFDAETGRLSGRRLFVDMAPLPGRPDGAAVDAQGHYWICANDAGLVHRFDPEGRLVESLAVPVSKPSMCAFGGPDLRTLFVTSIQPTPVPPGERAVSGAVLALQPGAPGLSEPRFLGAAFSAC
ncbi:SMP-30/gluconolactonase/LRE family protein [Ramlibacter sp. 2FC]|uniref:SMP-30/gluconolactonase/LRE family protein n=1 Tax=Ramlibacter sp. 2FC TaxID=2502188 RepID=UPI0010FA5F60|nr:SMP-30/gluconolactonase/LRE family protein [Ramlibacter sp. 2FC]